MTDHTTYTPISCALHSQYELAIMHRELLRIVWKDVAGIHHVSALHPRDLQTSNGAEYLIAVDKAGHDLSIRLDYILSSHTLER